MGYWAFNIPLRPSKAAGLDPQVCLTVSDISCNVMSFLQTCRCYLSVRNKWLHDEGVDWADASVHINDLSHASLYEAFHASNIQIQADLRFQKDHSESCVCG